MKSFIKKQIGKIIPYILSVIILFLIGVIFKIQISILISTLSFITSIFAIILEKTWLEDYRNELNCELETHKAKLSGYTLVTKLQYELEFKIYTESYEMIEKFFVKITRIFNPIIVEESLRIQDEIYQDLEDFYHFKRKYKPFYAPKISQKFSIIAYTINILMNEVNNCVERDWGESLKENLKKLQELKEYKDFQEGCDEIAILIRERIENMKIVE